MLKVKDGYAKVIGTTVNGSSDYLLLSNGGEQKLSDLTPFNAVRFGYNDTTNIWHCILKFTSNWIGSVTFMYSPIECQRDYWCLGNVNLRDTSIYFYIVNFSNNLTSLFKVTAEKNTSSNTYDVKLWVKNSNSSNWNPYGLIQVLAYNNVTITGVGNIGEASSAEPTGTYNATPANNFKDYFKAGSNISLTSANNIITISATDTWRNILVKGNSIGSANLNLKAGSNISLTQSGGDVTISSTNSWRTIKGNNNSIGSNALNITGEGVTIIPYTGTGEIKVQLTGDVTTHTHNTQYIKKVGDLPTSAYDVIITPTSLSGSDYTDTGGGIHVKAHTGTQFQLWLHDTSNVWYKKTGTGSWRKMDAGCADQLMTARNINGTPFNGTADITTANWGTARNITIGNTGRPVDGSSDVTWSLDDIGAATASHNHDGRYVYNYGGTDCKNASLGSSYMGMTTSSGIDSHWWHILSAGWNGEYRWNSQIGFPTQDRSLMYFRSGKDDNSGWGAWKRLALYSEIPSSLKNPYSFTVFGVSYDGSSAQIVDKTTFVSTLDEGTSTITDGTMLITSWTSNNGFADSGGVNVPYKRKAIHLWEYINSKTNSLYVTSLGTSNINLTWTKNGSTNYITIPGIADNGTHTETASGITANATNAGMLFGSGMYMTRTYGDSSAMPCSYGNVLNMAGGGSSQLLLGWSSSDSTTAYIYYRSHRDTTSGGWGAWRRLFYADELPSSMKNPNAIKFKDINGNTVSYDGSSACDLTAGTYIAKLPYGFSSWASGCTWGNTTGTSFASWNDSTGGSIDFRRDNPSSGKMSIKVDGRVYVNEGNNPVLSSESNNGFWGMRTPDGDNDWIRTSNNGLIPYISGGAGSGHSSLGTSTWYFSTAYIDKVYGSLQGNATSANNSDTATKLQTSRTIWGQSFDGTNNISGSMTGVGNINTSSSPAGTIYTNNWYRSIGTTGWYSETYGGGWYMDDSSWVKVWNDKGIYTDNEIKARIFRATTNDGAYLFGSSNAKISYLNNLLIFNTGDAIRFGATSWDYDQWAGLKYVSSSKTIYLGLADGTIFTKNATAQTGGILNLVNINTLTTPASLTLSGATKITSSAGLEIQGTITGADYATSEGYYTNAHNSIILRGDTTYGKSGILFTSPKGTTSINQTSDKGFIQFQSYGGTNTSGENNILLIGVGNDGTDRIYLQTPSVTGLKHAIGTSVYTIPTNGDDNTEGLLFRHNNYQYTKTIGYPTATSQTTTAYSDYYVLRMRTYSTWDSTNSKSVNGGYEYTISNTVPNANAVGNYPANKLAKAYNNGNISLDDVAKSYGSFFGMTRSSEGTNYPNNSTSWFHIFQSSYNNQSGGSDSTTNYWITQIVNRAGSTTPYIRSRGGGNDISTNWTDWKRILTEGDYPTLVIVNSNSSVATDKYANLTNGYVHLNLINPVTSKVISSGCIKGSGATTVTTDASGNIIVNSTNTQRGITDSYSGTSTTISLSQKGANDLYNTLTKAIPTSLKNPSALSWSGYSSGSYDGSAAKSISIPNNTNQLTNGAGYITSSGSCSSANRLAVNKEFAKGNNFLQYFNASSLSADTIGNAAPSTDWWHIIRMNHGNSSGYFSELAIALNQDTGVYWRTIRAGAVTKSWTRLANADEVLRYYDTLYSSSTPSNATPNATKNASNLTLPTTTVWNKLGIRQFNGTFPDNLSGSIYNYGAVISLPGNTSRFDLYYSHQSSYNKSTYTDNGLYYRTGWGDGASAASTYKYPWAKIIDSNNIGSQTVAKAGALDITNDVGSYNTPVYFTGGKPKECQTSIAKMFKVSGSNSLATVTDYLDNRTWSNQISVKTTSADDGYLMNGIKYYFELDTELDTANNTTFIAFVSNSESPTSGVAYYYAINPRVRIVESEGDVIARVDFALYDKSTNFTVNLIVYKVTTK